MGESVYPKENLFVCVSQWARHGMAQLQGDRGPWRLLSYLHPHQSSHGLYDAKSLPYLFALPFSVKDFMRSWTTEKEKLYKFISLIPLNSFKQDNNLINSNGLELVR